MNVAIRVIAWFVFLSIAGVLAFSWISGCERRFGIYRNVADYDKDLTRFARAAVPIADAAKRYFATTGHYPENLALVREDLAGQNLIAIEDNTVNGWSYQRFDDEAGFYMYFRLGWDPGFVYTWDGNKETWVFDPGDGNQKQEILIDP